MANDGGIGKLKARLAAIPQAIRERALVETKQQAEELAALMRRLAPEDTGALKESITVTGPGQATPPYSQPGGTYIVPDNAYAVSAGNSKSRIVHLVEWGTEKAEAQPFFYPAVRMLKKRYRQRIRAAINKAVKETAK